MESTYSKTRTRHTHKIHKTHRTERNTTYQNSTEQYRKEHDRTEHNRNKNKQHNISGTRQITHTNIKECRQEHATQSQGNTKNRQRREYNQINNGQT